MGYQGWSNYETWAVKLWIDNEEGSHTYWRERAEEIWEEAEATETFVSFTKYENARRELAGALHDAIDEDMPEAIRESTDGTMYADLLNAALSEVDWREIAQSWSGCFP